MRKISIILILSLLSLNAHAWAWSEHRFLAYMAAEHLTPSTQAFIDRYLDQHIMQYSNWMDRYVDSPMCRKSGISHMGYVKTDGTIPEDNRSNSIPSIRKSIDILSNWKEYNDSTVRVNIVYLIHLIPEIHCPSHIYLEELGTKEEGQKKIWAPFKYDGVKQRSYHYFWDSSLSKLYPQKGNDELLAILDTWDEAKIAEACKGTVYDWARDNVSRIRLVFDWYKPEVGSEFLQEEHGWLVEEQIRKGAYRLAWVLNNLFDKEGGK